MKNIPLADIIQLVGAREVIGHADVTIHQPGKLDAQTTAHTIT